jgi:hypothetical protein
MGAMNEFKVLDPNGHTRTTWDTSSPEEGENARRIYNDLVNAVIARSAWRRRAKERV